jgi:hypothetical protein
LADVSTGEFAPVTDEKALKFATDMGCSAFVAVSAKTGKNLKAVFEKAVSIVLAAHGDNNHKEASTHNTSNTSDGGPVNIVVTKNTKKKDSGRCVLI